MPPSRVALYLASDFVCATRKPHEEVTPPALPPTERPCRPPRFNRYWPAQYAMYRRPERQDRMPVRAHRPRPRMAAERCVLRSGNSDLSYCNRPVCCLTRHAALFALLFGCLLLGAALFDRNVVWIITPGEILIGEQRPFGKLHRRLIRDDELSGMRLRKSIGKSVEFSLVFETESGNLITSPPLPDVTQVHETAARISRLLRLPDPEPVENPLDAVNAGIRLGKPVNPKRVRGLKVITVLLAGMLSIPFVHALWDDKLSPFG